MHGQVLQLGEYCESEEQPENAEQQPYQQQPVTVHAKHEGDLGKIRQFEAGLASRFLSRLSQGGRGGHHDSRYNTRNRLANLATQARGGSHPGAHKGVLRYESFAGLMRVLVVHADDVQRCSSDSWKAARSTLPRFRTRFHCKTVVRSAEFGRVGYVRAKPAWE